MKRGDVGHLVVRTAELRPLIEGYIERCGRAEFSMACQRRVYDIIHTKTEYVTHKVADKICSEIAHPEYLHLVEVLEVQFNWRDQKCDVPAVSA